MESSEPGSEHDIATGRLNPDALRLLEAGWCQSQLHSPLVWPPVHLENREMSRYFYGLLQVKPTAVFSIALLQMPFSTRIVTIPHEFSINGANPL